MHGRRVPVAWPDRAATEFGSAIGHPPGVRGHQIGEGTVVATIAAADRPTRVRFRVMAFLLGLSFLTYFDRVCIGRVLGDIKADLGLSNGQVGLVLGAFWLAYALFEIPGGWLGDRDGARRTLTRVVLAWSICTTLTGFATGFATLLASRFLFGIGEAGAYPNMARVQSAWLPAGSRARAGGLLWLAARWGGAFAPDLFSGVMALGAVATGRGWLPFPEGVAPWRFGFVVAGLVGLAWCVAFRRTFRDDPADDPAVNASELALIRSGDGAGAPGHGPAAARVWRDLLGSRSLWALAGHYFLASFGWSFFVSWMPLYLNDVRGIRYDTSSSFWKQPLFYGGISCLAGGILSDRLVRATGRRRAGRAVFPMVGLATAAAAMFAVRSAADPRVVVVLICVAGAAYDFGQGANWASIVDLGGRHAGLAAGFINMLANFSNAAQPPVGAWIFGRFGWDALFAVYAGVFLAAALLWLGVDPRRPFHRDAEAPC